MKTYGPSRTILTGLDSKVYLICILQRLKMLRREESVAASKLPEEFNS